MKNKEMKKPNLIGISGHSQSGKDTVGKIIQFLIDKEETSLSYQGLEKREYSLEEQFYRWDLLINSNVIKMSIYNYKIKKFADKLKDIICILLSCSRNDLESPKFKSKELGSDWWYYSPKSGTNVITPYEYYLLVEDNPKNINKYTLVKPTVRFLLQKVGTDLFRNQLNSNIWVNALFSEYKSSVREADGYVHQNSINGSELLYKDDPRFEPDHFPKWIITDVRFKNCADHILNMEGILIHIKRNSTNKSNSHISETDLDDYSKFNYTIENNGSITDLIFKVEDILKDVYLI